MGAVYPRDQDAMRFAVNPKLLKTQTSDDFDSLDAAKSFYAGKDIDELALLDE